MYRISTDGLPTLSNYGEALARWEQTKPWKVSKSRRFFYEDNERPLANSRAKHHMVIHKLDNGDIACRLHSTNVVTYHKDGRITLVRYPSRSTDAFASAVAPRNITPMFDHSPGIVWIGPGHYWSGENVGFRIEKTLTLRPDEDHGYGWWPEQIEPFVLFRLDKKRTAAAMKALHYMDFRNWLNAAQVLIGRPFGSSEFLWSWRDKPEGTILEIAADRSRWPELLEYDESASRILWYLRERIYHCRGCVSRTELPWIKNHKELCQIKYGGQYSRAALFEDSSI